MKLSSTLSKTRLRIYALLGTGALVALGASALGALIVGLGHSQPDVVQPFWETGEYVALLGVFNLGIYAALFWQVNRLSRRDARKPSPSTLLDPLDAEDTPEPSTPSPAISGSIPPAREHLPSARPPVTRRVRGNASSLHLDP